MDNFYTILLIILAVISIIFAIVYFFMRLAKTYVIQNSDALESLDNVNSEYFHMFNFEIDEMQHYTKRQKNKSAFDRATRHDIVMEYLYKYGGRLQETMEIARQNASIYNEYSNICNEIYAKRHTDWYKLSIHEKIELKMFGEMMFNPPRTISLRIDNRYTSPKGQKRYCNYCILNTQQIEEAFAELDKMEEAKQAKQYQRSMMTDSLRYDILKRDGFKCVLCGCSAEDGVKLHVDHIVPIAKGGLTVASNLRTLCERCNLGKSDKYDPDGIN